MHSLSSLLLITLLFTIVIAVPTPARQQRKGRSFKVNRVKRANYVPSGRVAMQKAYAKYGWTVPQDLTVSNAASGNSSGGGSGNGESGEVSASPEQNDAEFLSPVTIGGQTLMMDFDTGSSDLWVFNTELSSADTSTHTSFNPSKSSTFKQLQGASFAISYGDGSGASGNVGTDTVNIGGATVTTQAVELATTVSQTFVQDANSDGLVGLAFSKLNTVQPNQQKTFFDNVQASLEQPVFTADLKHGTAGSYDFGTIDSSKFTGEITYVPIDNSQGFWQFDSTRFAVGSQAINAAGGAAIADTGTSLMLVDEAVATAYWAAVPSSQLSQEQGGYIFPCSSTLPDFHVGFGATYTATISGSLLNFAQVDGATCFGGLQSNSGQDLQIYGDVMFKSQFVVFDGGHNQLGFAPHA
ncbi:MAG: hypothetical protein M1827_002244 [Pycnora praestabilis]|nr:MAG: hypothetical protein M1827_002244 [Pycnora praestabilis]